jgi:AAHS family 4-hydroxybenzoate transporter-like MFS transporter
MSALSFGEALDRQKLRPFQLVTVGLVLMALVIDGLDYQLLALLAPVILQEWEIARADFGAAMAAALFGMAFGAAGGGWIGDRIGRLRALVLAVVLFGLATMAASRAQGVGTLAALRVLGGIGFGAAGPNAIALASEWMPQRLRTYVVAVLAIGTPAGGMLGALVLPILLPGLGWRGVFALLGAVAVALAGVLVISLRESPPWLLRRGRGEAARAAARRVLPAETAWSAPPPPAPPPGTGSARAQPAALFSAAFARLNLGIGLSFAALTAIVYGLGAWMPSFLTAAGFTLDQALAASFTFNACSIAGALAAGWLARAQGSRRVMLASALATAVLLVLFGLGLDASAGAPLFAARLALDSLAGAIGAAASIGITTLYAMAAMLYPAEIRSSGIGLGMTAGRVGGIAMSFAGGHLLDAADGSALILFGALAACALLATSAGLIVRRHIARA